MNKKQLILFLAAFYSCSILASQNISVQFMQTEYDIKELFSINELSYAVGDAHWDQAQKSYKSTILKTLDRGTTWERLSVPYTVDLWDVHFIDASEGWVAGESGCLLHTLDGGTSWNKAGIGTNLDFKSLFFSHPSLGWVVANEEIPSEYTEEPEAWIGHIWHTNDGGATWNEQALPEDAGLLHSVYFVSDSKGWALGVKNKYDNGMYETRCVAYHTTDGGSTWVEKFSPDLELVFTDIDFPEEEFGYIVGFKTSSGENDGLFFRTSDGGESWERSSNESDILWEIDFVDTQRGYAIGADYYSAWGPPVYRTIDGGDTWDMIMMDEHDGQGLYGLSVFENRVIGLGDDGYMIQSDDPWGELTLAYENPLFTSRLIDTLYHFEDVFFINSTKGWAVGQKSAGPEAWAQVIMHTNDGGATWSEQYSLQIDPDWAYAFRLNAVQFINEETGWAVGCVHTFGDESTSGILFTNDGGENWTQQAQEVTEDQIVDLFFLDDMNGWALTNSNSYPEGYILLLKTINGGSSWEIVNTGQEGSVTIGFAVKTGSLLFQNEQKGWILGAQSELLKTEDSGITWTRISLPEDWTNTHAISFANGQQGIICGEANFMTGNGGETWNKGFEHEHTQTDLCFTDSLQGWMVGEWGEIFYTLDGGTSWTKVDHKATSAALKAVSFPDKTTGWAVGRGGTIIRIEASSLSMRSKQVPEQSEVNLEQNNPNPFSYNTEISFNTACKGNVLLVLYDINGRVIRTLAEGFRNEGKHTVVWNKLDESGREVSPGVYFCRLITQEGTASKTMVVR